MLCYIPQGSISKAQIGVFVGRRGTNPSTNHKEKGDKCGIYG